MFDRKEYMREYNKEYELKNRAALQEKRKRYREENIQKIRVYQKEYGKQYREANKEKLQEYSKNYHENNYERLKPEKIEYWKRYRMENKDKIAEYSRSVIDKVIFNNTKKRAKQKNLPFNLDQSDIAYPDTCPVFGYKLVRGTNRSKANSPSVDRIIPSLGYVKGNIQIISNKANTMKQDATPEELRMFARWVLKTFPEESDGKA